MSGSSKAARWVGLLCFILRLERGETEYRFMLEEKSSWLRTENLFDLEGHLRN
jgi:hypothetical protein